MPVKGLSTPILIGSSPRALMMYGATNCAAPTVRPALSSVRRPSPLVVDF